jgi:hypothetical protein
MEPEQEQEQDQDRDREQEREQEQEQEPNRFVFVIFVVTVATRRLTEITAVPPEMLNTSGPHIPRTSSSSWTCYRISTSVPHDPDTARMVQWYNTSNSAPPHSPLRQSSFALAGPTTRKAPWSATRRMAIGGSR